MSCRWPPAGTPLWIFPERRSNNTKNGGAVRFTAPPFWRLLTRNRTAQTGERVCFGKRGGGVCGFLDIRKHAEHGTPAAGERSTSAPPCVLPLVIVLRAPIALKAFDSLSAKNRTHLDERSRRIPCWGNPVWICFRERLRFADCCRNRFLQQFLIGFQSHGNGAVIYRHFSVNAFGNLFNRTG